MIDPLFWLGLSLLLVALSLTAVLVAALPALQELARAARSAEKLFDTLRHEFPPTLEAIRLTGMEINELKDDINEGVKSATEVVKQVDEGINSTRRQVKNAQLNTRRVMAGVKAAWKTLNKQAPRHANKKHLRTPQKAVLEQPITSQLPSSTSSPHLLSSEEDEGDG